MVQRMDEAWPICELALRPMLDEGSGARCSRGHKPLRVPAGGLKLIEFAISVVAASACTWPASPRLPPSTHDYLAWKYEVVSRADLELEVEARFYSTEDSSFRVDKDGMDFISDLEQARGSSWERVAWSGSAWAIACRVGCHVRYRFALRQAADRLADVNTAIASGNVVFSPPSTWLLHPKSPGPERIWNST